MLNGKGPKKQVGQSQYSNDFGGFGYGADGGGGEVYWDRRRRCNCLPRRWARGRWHRIHRMVDHFFHKLLVHMHLDLKALWRLINLLAA